MQIQKYDATTACFVAVIDMADRTEIGGVESVLLAWAHKHGEKKHRQRR